MLFCLFFVNGFLYKRHGMIIYNNKKWYEYANIFRLLTNIFFTLILVKFYFFLKNCLYRTSYRGVKFIRLKE